jgi:hypothetical protein
VTADTFHGHWCHGCEAEGGAPDGPLMDSLKHHAQWHLPGGWTVRIEAVDDASGHGFGHPPELYFGETRSPKLRGISPVMARALAARLLACAEVIERYES